MRIHSSSSGKWEPQGPSLLKILATVSSHQLLSLQARLVTLSSGVLGPAHSNRLNSKFILTEAVPIYPTQAKHHLFILWSPQNLLMRFRKCPLMHGKCLWQTWPHPHYSLSTISQYHTDEGVMALACFSIVQSTYWAERALDFTIGILAAVESTHDTWWL